MEIFILVRPDRTKLHYSNYTVEKPYNASNLRAPKKLREYKQKPVKSEKTFNRSKHSTEIQSSKVNDRRSSGIYVRLFNPSQLSLSEHRPTVPRAKIQWRVASTRTGPPPTVTSLETDELYHLNVKQDAEFTGLGVGNPWVGTRKPNPFIPKRRKTEGKNSAAYVKLTAGNKTLDESKRGCEISETIGPFNLSSKNIHEQAKTNYRMEIKDESKELRQCQATVRSFARHPLPASTSTSNTQRQALIGNIKRKCLEGDVERLDQTLAVVPRKHENDTFPPKSPFKYSETPAFLSSQTQVQPLASNVNIPKVQQQPESGAKLPEFETQTKVTRTEGPLLQFSKVGRLGSSKPRQICVCNVCSKGFVSTFALNQHISIHANSWPYKCEVCVQVFKVPKN